jgi:Dienelactone hydrolase family
MKALLGLLLLFSVNAYSDRIQYLSPEETQRRLKMLDYDNNFKILSIEKYREKRDLEILTVRLSSKSPIDPNKSLITEFFWYRKKEAGKRPLIILSPPIVGVDPAEKLIASAFTRNAPYYNTFILKYDEKINDKKRHTSALNNAFLNSITQGRILIDFAKTQPEFIDTNKIGCYGMSLGGVMSAMLAEVDPRVKAAVIIVGGGNFPEILANSNQGIVKGYREARMKEEHITTKGELTRRLRQSLLFDPLYFASRVPTRNIYMVIGLEDTAVPTKNQMELWRAFGEPQNAQYDADHFPTILRNAPHHKPIMDFLEWRFSLEK